MFINTHTRSERQTNLHAHVKTLGDIVPLHMAYKAVNAAYRHNYTNLLYWYFIQR
jgi:hypothetical protein